MLYITTIYALKTHCAAATPPPESGYDILRRRRRSLGNTTQPFQREEVGRVATYIFICAEKMNF
jgi:hypothetical protein